MAAASTAGVAGTALFTKTSESVAAEGLTTGDVGTALLLGGTATATSVISGILGSRIHSDFQAKQYDPESLIANHDLHRLVAQGVVLRLEILTLDEERFTENDRINLTKLAEIFPSEWDELTSTPGFDEQLEQISEEELSGWYHKAAESEPHGGQPVAGTMELWQVVFKTLGKKHECDLSAPAFNACLLYTSDAADE